MLLNPKGGWSLVGENLVIEVESQTPGFYEEQSSQQTTWTVSLQADQTYILSAVAYSSLQVPMDIPEPPGLFVPVGPDQGGQVNGGSGETGGIDALFDEITLEGEFTGQFNPTLIADVTREELKLITFFMPTDPMMIWDIQFTGEFTGLVELTFGYDDSLLLPGFDEADLWVWHTLQGPPVSWEKLTVTDRDLVNNTITVLTGSFSEFAIGSPVPEPATLLLMTAAGLPMVLKRRRSRS